VGLYGVETCRGQCYRYQTPLNLLIYKSPFGNDERVTDSVSLILSKTKEVGELGDEGSL
jgi:hypothetical protein